MPTRFAFDLHIHSRFTRGASPEMNLEQMAHFAKLKGLGLIGTGDFTHPAWFLELKEKLVPSDLEGLYEYRGARFLLTTEISCFFNPKGRGRKIHNILLAPSLEVALHIRQRLRRYGSLSLDGVPALSITAHDLLKLLKEISSDAQLIPAHILNPLNALFSQRGSIHSLTECFGEDAGEVLAVETGLAADPSMLWRISALDEVAIVSGSNALSPTALGLEATVLAGPQSFRGICESLRQRDPEQLLSTIEYYPEVNKHYFDGHRSCKVSISPEESVARLGICPVCNRPLNQGVMHHLQDLADRTPEADPAGRVGFHRLLPLRMIVSQTLGKQINTGLVEHEYLRLVQSFGNELSVLLDIPLSYLEKVTTPAIVQAIASTRDGHLPCTPGSDGVPGQVRIPRLSLLEAKSPPVQLSLF